MGKCIRISYPNKDDKSNAPTLAVRENQEVPKPNRNLQHLSQATNKIVMKEKTIPESGNY